MLAQVPRQFEKLTNEHRWLLYLADKLRTSAKTTQHARARLADVSVIIMTMHQFSTSDRQDYSSRQWQLRTCSCFNCQEGFRSTFYIFTFSASASTISSFRRCTRTIVVNASNGTYRCQQPSSGWSWFTIACKCHWCTSNQQQQQWDSYWHRCIRCSNVRILPTQRDPWSNYVPPTVFSVREQQRITNWTNVANLIFAGDGQNYLRRLTLCHTRERSIMVFLHCPDIHFT